jgi:anti-sigma factor (TIGR02949 family)
MIKDADLPCRAVVRRLYDYLDGEIDTSGRDAIRAHLQVCDGCAREAAFEARVLDGLRARLRGVWAPPDLVTRVGFILRRCPPHSGA